MADVVGLSEIRLLDVEVVNREDEQQIAAAEREDETAGLLAIDDYAANLEDES